ncbi:MAG: hypothetical protein AB3K77_03120 [Methanosarcinaceae archaeon]|uniref:hypothetical protein n=1 Tax=Methanosarcina sp. MTP4 TaxID=1434100 RepID=UPI000A7E7BFA|nr:hypothetical protein [Methanosarcina sp. MTP4]
MTTNKIFRIGALILAFLLIGVVFTAPASASSNTETSNVHYNYYNYFFGLESHGNTVITKYGKLPELETENQKESWDSTLEELGNKMKDTLASRYMYPHGEVVTCGANAEGYFVILFQYGNVDEPLMNEIYVLVDNAAKEMDIQDIPVEFGYGIYQSEIPLDVEQGIYHTYGENVEKLSESEIQAIEEHMKEKPEQLFGDGNLANYGEVPLLKDKKEIETWWNKLYSIKKGTREKILPYLEKGQVVAYGMQLTRLHVDIYDGLPSEEKAALAEEIYQIIDEEARKQNMTDIPVAFEESGHYVPDEEVMKDEGTAGEETNMLASGEKSTGETNNSSNNDSESDNESSSSEEKSNENNSAPGFGLLGGLTCLYGGWRIRKK